MFFPSLSARAMLEGMSARGLARDPLIADAQLDRTDLEQKEGLLPAAAFERLWTCALQRTGRETLPLEVGLAVPYGAFGALDFLAGTSETVAASLHSLASYFQSASTSFRLVIDEEARDPRVRIESGGLDPRVARVSDLFTLGVLLGRFRALTSGPFRASLDVCGDAPVDPDAFRRVAGTTVRFGRRISVFDVARSCYEARLRSADARLHETLRALADTLDLGSAGTDFERAVRARLRTALPEGRADAPTMARALGVSERTLQRRLDDGGTTFSAVLESFRHEEALRLLDDRRLSLAEVAARLGFAEQSSFNRAFKRWTGASPAASRRKST